MPNLQKGFIPVVFLVLIAVIAVSSVFVVKNVSFKTFQPTPDKGFQGSISAQLKPHPSPTVSVKKSNNRNVTSTSTPTLTPKTTSTTSSTSGSSNNSSSTNPTSTPTPNPVSTSTPTPTPTSQLSSPYVRVTYPNGGESLQVGNNITTTWDTNMTLGSCLIQTIDSNNTGMAISSSTNVTNRSVDWAVSMGNTSLTEKQYKIYMVCHDFNGGTQYATSANYFTIHN